MAYNLTPIENMTNPADLITAANSVSGGYYGVVILAAFYILSFRIWADRGLDSFDSFVYASFIAEVVAVVLWAIGVLAWEWALLPLVLVFAGFVIDKFRS